MSSSGPNRPPRLGSWRIRTELGLFGFAPALGLLAFEAREVGLWWVLFALPAAIGVLVALVLALVVRSANAEPFEFGDIDDASGEIVGHVTSYLLPALVNFTGGADRVVTTAAVMAFILLIHISTGRVHVNPLLYLIGVRTYSAATTGGHSYYLMARSDPADWAGPIRCSQVGSALLVERRRHQPVLDPEAHR